VAKLAAIMDDQDAEVGYQLMACRLLASEGLAGAIRAMERDDTELQVRRHKVKTAVGLVLEHHPEVAPELAERFVRACLEAMEPKDLTETLKDRLGFWTAEPLDDETLSRLWREHGLPELAELVEPAGLTPAPRCGFIELPAPEPEPFVRPEPTIGPRPEPPPEPEPDPRPDPGQGVSPGLWLGMGDLTISIPDERQRR
jgi:hypothetical protein